MARCEMAQLTRYTTCESSFRDSMSTAMIGGRVSGVMMGGSMSCACKNSNMLPMVQAVVSFTEGWGSCVQFYLCEHILKYMFGKRYQAIGPWQWFRNEEP